MFAKPIRGMVFFFFFMYNVRKVEIFDSKNVYGSFESRGKNDDFPMSFKEFELQTRRTLCNNISPIARSPVRVCVTMQ